MFRLRTLGSFELLREPPDPAAPPLLQRGKPLALLAYCTADRRRPHAREALSALLWADAAPERARHNLRQAIWRLRRVLGEVLATRDDAILSIGPSLVTDREQFLDAIARQDVRAALSLYGGPFLADVSLPGGDELEEWVSTEQRRLEAMLVRAVGACLHDSSSALTDKERREMIAQLLARAGTAPEAHRVAIDGYLALGDTLAARASADELEGVAARSDTTLTASQSASLARARETELESDADASDAVTLELVGRDEPFALALSCWKRARQGVAQSVVFTGVAGVGKTRLLDAIAKRCHGRRGSVVTLRANPGEQEVAFGLASSLARALSQQPGAVGVSAESARELVLLDPGLASRFRAAPGTLQAEDSIRRRALAVLDLLQAVSEQHPLALIIDDWHWMDGASRQLLEIVLARAHELPLLLVGASRPGGDFGASLPAPQRVALLPLEADAVIEAIYGTGQWPREPEVERFIHALADACDGIPLNVVGRLSVAIEAGLLSRQQGAWRSSNWTLATSEIAASSPIARRMSGCTDVERSLLLVLSLAGAPLHADVVSHLADDPRILSTLLAKGMVRLDSEHWTTSHDLLGEQLIAQSSVDAVRTAHHRLADALLQSRVSGRLPAALRHYAAAGAKDRAASVFVQIVSRARSQGERRSADELVSDLLGDAFPSDARHVLCRAVPWHLRRAGSLGRALAASAVLLSSAALFAAWQVVRTPALVLLQTPLSSAPAMLYGPTAHRLAPPPVVRLGDGATSYPETSVRVRLVSGNAQLLAGTTVQSVGGLASFGGLRIASTDSIIQLRFEAEGYRGVEIAIRLVLSMPVTTQGRAIRLVEGRFFTGANTQVVNATSDSIVVARGALIDGVVQMQYSANWPAASVWASMTPTWGDPAAQARDLTPLITPVRSDIIDLPVSVTAPTTAGRYWIVFVMAAEPSGGYALSATNWTVGHPVWNDGNDLLQTPDSAIMEANRTGITQTLIAYRSGWQQARPDCLPEIRNGLRYCPMPIGMFGLRVVVR